MYCIVPVTGSRSLALADLAGEALLVRAVTAAVAADLHPVVVTDDVASVRTVLGDAAPLVGVTELSGSVISTGPVLVHDPLCPLTPPAFLASVAALGDNGATAVAVLTTTDTVKVVAGDVVTGTVDRSGVAVIASPLVGPTDLIIEAAEMVLDLPRLVHRLQLRTPVDLVPAPATCARVGEPSELDLLTAVHDARHPGPES